MRKAVWRRGWQTLFALNVSLLFATGTMIVRAQNSVASDDYGAAIVDGCVKCQDQNKTILECYYPYIGVNKDGDTEILDPRQMSAAAKTRAKNALSSMQFVTRTKTRKRRPIAIT